MADNNTPHQPPVQVGRLISLIPVGLKEAALDSPTFRATAVHFAEQIELIEKWLDGYVKASSKLAHEISSLEGLVNSFVDHAIAPSNVSEAVIDHDYTLLAMRRWSEGAKDYWLNTLGGLKKLDATVNEPIRGFINGDLRAFKEARRNLDLLQRNYDSLQYKYSAQAKTKEPSSLREDAFQLHEARKAYLKASMDFCTLAPQLRMVLDKLVVGIFTDQWRDMKISRESISGPFTKWSQEMDRVRGWTSEMENSEKTFKRELQSARKQMEDSAEVAARPSRELDDYSVSTVPYLGSHTSSMKLKSPADPRGCEKQGWLYLRTYTGKPSRTHWVRRWGFVKNGIFGWLVQGSRSGGVEESEKVGVLLCNVRPAFQEERRFCFEVKTKNHTLLLQAETQTELTEWIAVFEVAKRKALETGDMTGTRAGVKDPAFSITGPVAPEFAAQPETLAPGGDEGLGAALEKIPTLGVPERDPSATRSSVDIASIGPSSSRRSTLYDKDPESGRDHASRIIQKLDLHRKSAAGSQVAGSPSPSTPSITGGIASLISATHGVLPIGPGAGIIPSDASASRYAPGLGLGIRSDAKEMPSSTLAPSTLANPPAPTNLSKTAVVVGEQRGVGVGQTAAADAMSSGIMANLWGSSAWAYVNRLERGEMKPSLSAKATDPSTSHSSDTEQSSGGDTGLSVPGSKELSPLRHRNTISLDGAQATEQRAAVVETQDYPNYYPVQLKAQDAQFRLLFPYVKREEKVVMVFRATWNPNDQQEFPGRAYVTTKDIYFYSHHLGLVLTTAVSLTSIEEVTAAPGRNCDFLYLHFNEVAGQERPTRITIKTFLEPLKLLQSRLNFLVRDAASEEPSELESIIKSLIKMEFEEIERSPSLASWEDVPINTPVDEGIAANGPFGGRKHKDLFAPVRVEHRLDVDGRMARGKDIAKFKLPKNPVEYSPQGHWHLAVEKQFMVSPKALFHVLFGDKSAVFQLLYHERRAENIKQKPWQKLERGHLKRDFEFDIETSGLFGKRRETLASDYQIIDVLNDHLCYVVTDKKTPWHLPYKKDFMQVSKIVITHIAKSKCRLAIFTKVEWSQSRSFMKGTISFQELHLFRLTLLNQA